MPTQIEKLDALASHLLDGYRGLGERYALLNPMLFDDEVCKRHGSGKQAFGFRILRSSLFLTCAQDIAKYSLDRYPNAPSIRNILKVLGDPHVVANLRTRYADWSTPHIVPETDPQIIEAMKAWEAREILERGVEFDDYLQNLLALWPIYSTSPTLLSLAIIRDKVTAHTEVQFAVDEYKLVNIAGLQIKWTDIRATMKEMRHAIDLIGTVVRNSGFVWDAFDRQVAEMSAGFWAAPA